MNKRFLVLMALVFASPMVFAAGNAKKIAEGKFLYEDWGCIACHGIGDKVKAKNPEPSPDLKGVFTRRKLEWIKKFTKNPAAMIEAGDPDAVEMAKKYDKTMKTFKITDADWDKIFEYIKSEGGI